MIPSWVHQFLRILQKRKLGYIASMKGARFDINELGGGDASSTVISPALFDEFVAPYDTAVIAAAHEAGQRIVYHTCGGMMAILERVAGMRSRTPWRRSHRRAWEETRCSRRPRGASVTRCA